MRPLSARQCKDFLPIVDTANRPWPTSVCSAAGLLQAGQRAARSSERWPAGLPRGHGFFIGSRPSTRARGGAAWSLPLSKRERKWTPKRATLLCWPPCAVLRNLRLGGGSRCCWLGLSKSGRLLPLTLPQRFFSAHSAPFGQVFDFKVGAGEGNRTLVISLEVGGAPYRRTGVRDIA
jgi:hypothetical protein